jgi:2-dehydro-3-deoxy-D-arabinonate dehydratase
VYLTRHQTARGTRWALNEEYLPTELSLGLLLELPGEVQRGFLESIPGYGIAEDALLPPLEPMHEVWASGVTYLSSEQAREAESGEGDLYARVYEALRSRASRAFLKGDRLASSGARPPDKRP